ncbi:unnamed protein product [Bursaphelenchus okinawaensis]|uniref:Helicase ATP-binding domain-containing protein n=1 Tax=Bursaphelenchus okinawaensis TaxID=465554 RepID=A0A811LRE5_9BILA|nr:unnamed protein product [Bursaphelenchus okinawaensis]CAG9127846.1 unnamed protein product [Bursaphelenchus okinawaensis]
MACETEQVLKELCQKVEASSLDSSSCRYGRDDLLDILYIKSDDEWNQRGKKAGLAPKELKFLNRVPGKNYDDIRALYACKEYRRNMLNFYFPDEYAYLQQLKRIDEGAVKQNRVLFDYLMREQNNMADLIQKQIAIICLYWAQGLIESRQPIFLDAILQYKEHRIVKYVVGGKEKMATITYFSCLMPEERRQPNFRSAADRINLVTVIREGIVLFEGFVHYKKNGEVVLKVDRVKKDLLTELQQVTALDVDLYEQPNDFVPQAMLNAVQGVKMGLIDSILMPKPTEKYEQALPGALRQYDKQPHLAFLNAEQKAVIHAVDTHAHAGFPFVLYGPPGTGKTETISALVLTLLKKTPNTRILICTPSNMAANRVTEKLMEHFGKPYNDVLTEKNLLRLFSSGNNYKRRDKKFDNVISANLALKRYVIPEVECLIRRRVIVCTLSSTTHLIKHDVPRGHFDYIMIDEAGQASEAEVWIPLGGLADRTTSVFLYGDPKQLGPVITLNLPKYMTDKFVSPLHRFLQNPQYLKDFTFQSPQTRAIVNHTAQSQDPNNHVSLNTAPDNQRHVYGFLRVLSKNGIRLKKTQGYDSKNSKVNRSIKYSIEFIGPCSALLSRLKLNKKMNLKERRQFKALKNLVTRNPAPSLSMTPFHFYTAIGFIMFAEQFFPLSSEKFYSVYRVEI